MIETIKLVDGKKYVKRGLRCSNQFRCLFDLTGDVKTMQFWLPTLQRMLFKRNMAGSKEISE